MGKCSNTFFQKCEGEQANILRFSYIWILPMGHMKIWPNDLSFGSLEVIWGQMSFSCNFWQNGDGALGMGTICLPCRDTPTDSQHHIAYRWVTTWPRLNLITRPWHGVKLRPCFLRVNIHVFRRISTTEKRWGSIFLPICLCSKDTREEQFHKKHWPLTFGTLQLKLS